MATRDINSDAALAVATALVALVREVARDEVRRAGPAPTDLLDQTTSGLGRRLHCRAFREGKLEGRRVGRRIVVTRQALQRFLETFGRPGGRLEHEAPVDDVKHPLDRELRGLGFARSRTGSCDLTGTPGTERTSTRTGR